MAHTIACNLGSYRQYGETAFEHLARIGLANVELPCPEPEELDDVQAELDRYGLTPTSMVVRCQMDADDVVLRFARDLETVEKLGVGIVFTSVKTGEIDPEYVHGRLQNMGDAAAERGVVVALETHPDLVTNAAVALETMACVAHPNIRVNFDTANVYYYNEGVTASGELKAIAEYVAAVHLKDTDGGYRSWHFPALGEGVVDFPEVFRILDEAGFDGPCSLELEGVKGEEITREGVEGRIERSMVYLREQGIID